MSHYVNRPLLYVSRHHDASLCRYLSQHGWKLVFANSLEDLAALPLDGPFSAGLLDFQSGFSASWICSNFTSLRSGTSPCRWISKGV